MKTIILSAAVTSALALLSACGAASDQSASTAKSDMTTGDIQPGSFKVYLVSRQVPTPSCDVHTKLELVNGFAGPMAQLQNAVSGPCEIAVDETPRVFNLQEVAGQCGTRLYKGDHLEVVDNRARLCDDATAADLIVKEAKASVEERLVTTTFYSFDANH